MTLAFVINATYDSSVTSLQTSNVTLYDQYTAAVQTAVSFFESHISSNITVNIVFGYGDVPSTDGSAGTALLPGSIGTSSSSYDTFTYAQLYSAVSAVDGASGASAVQKAALASLPATDQTGGATFSVNYAEELALGLAGATTSTGGAAAATSATIDGAIGIGADASLNWAWGQTPASTNGNDPVGTLEHEISEVLGRTANGNQNGAGYTLMDMFRYSSADGKDTDATGAAAGSRQLAYNTTVPTYFSYDGKTVTLLYETPADVAQNSDLVDWAPSVGADSFGDGSGVPSPVSTADLQEINVLGYTICFLAGTMIRTPEGEAPVETLRRGDLVLTADGAVKPVSWLGRQTISKRFADPLRSWPVRVKAGALGANVPARDLLLSPDHALLVEGVLIHAGALVNGTSIVRETIAPDVFVYYHVELDDHSLILAENAPAETFIDNVDRLAFDNWEEHVALYPEGRSLEELPNPRAKACRQVPARIRAALDALAIDIGAAAANAA
jgi:hypothetical protein